MPDPCRNSICKNTGLICTAGYRAACTSQAEANQSRRIHPSSAGYQTLILYSWGFFVAAFFSYLSLYCNIINRRDGFFSFFCTWLCSGPSLFSALELTSCCAHIDVHFLTWSLLYLFFHQERCLTNWSMSEIGPEKFYFGLFTFTV